MMGVLESNIDQLPKIAFSAMLVHLASKKLKKFHVEGPRQQFWTCTGFIQHYGIISKTTAQNANQPAAEAQSKKVTG